MTFEGLHISRSGVAASQRALDVIGHNIANVGTPGYTRLRTDQASTERVGPSLVMGPGATGMGVRIVGVSRVRDALLDANFRGELGSSGNAQVLADSMARIESAVGPLNGNLSDALTAFWNGWEELSLDPTSATARSQVIDAAESVSRSLQQASSGLASARDEGRATAEALLGEQRTALAAVADLNQRIIEQEAVGDSPNALLDQRDLHLDSLAKTLGATVNHLEDGSVHVAIGGYDVVRGSNVSSLSIAGDPPTLQTGEGVTLVPGGEIGAHLIGVRATTEQIQTELDAVAVALRDVVNTQHAAGFTEAGVAGGDLFSATGAADFSLAAGFTIADLAASASGAAADGNHAIEMAALRSTDLGGGTIDQQVRSLIGRVGAASADATARAEMNESMLTDLEATRSSLSGVNLDEELTMMLQYQRAYEASARVMTSVDEMLDVLINRTGRVGR